MSNLNKAFLSQINRLSNTRARGHYIESLATQYLVDQGLIIVKRNFRCRLGEIDIIGLNSKSTLIFAEVRFRKNKHYGGPLESIDWRKQQKLIRTAHFFLKTHPIYAQTSCRFDVLAVTLKSKDSIEPHIEWIQGAFTLK